MSIVLELWTDSELWVQGWPELQNGIINICYLSFWLLRHGSNNLAADIFYNNFYFLGVFLFCFSTEEWPKYSCFRILVRARLPLVSNMSSFWRSPHSYFVSRLFSPCLPATAVSFWLWDKHNHSFVSDLSNYPSWVAVAIIFILFSHSLYKYTTCPWSSRNISVSITKDVSMDTFVEHPMIQ